VDIVPGMHNTQVPVAIAPKAVEYAPAAQFAHCVMLAAPDPDWYVPATHLTHVAIAEAPNADDVVPGVQRAHVPAVIAPDVPEYVPAAHCVHQAELVEPVEVSNVPPTHASQAEEDAIDWYFPVAHTAHAPSPLALA
jgi:hypothetical protein